MSGLENLKYDVKDLKKDVEDEKLNSCSCSVDCDCGHNCNCDEEIKCDNDYHCETETTERDLELSNKNDKCCCDDNLKEKQNDQELAVQYLNLAKQVQADFDNYRRHALEDIKQAKINGQISVIETFLPCLDTFKEAKKSINDEKILQGIEMIENKIIEALGSLGVEKINSIGQIYNPHFHNVIAVVNDQEKENDIILDEYQAGYKFNDKIIRYAKVIVNKKEDK